MTLKVTQGHRKRRIYR